MTIYLEKFSWKTRQELWLFCVSSIWLGLAHNRWFSKCLNEQTNEWNKGSCELGNKVVQRSKGITYVKDSLMNKRRTYLELVGVKKEPF